MTLARRIGLILLPALLATLVVGGCGGPGGSASGTNGGTVTEKGGAPPKDKGEAGETAATVKPDPASVPEALRHEAFAYSGLEVGKAVSYGFARVEGEKPEPGTQTAELKSVADGSADYTVKREGSLLSLGSEDMRVGPDGVYLVESTLGKPEKPVLVMPAKIQVGDTWKDDYELTTSDGRKVKFKGSSKAERTEKLKAAGKEYETLLVVQTASMDNAGETGQVSSKTWYAKGVGVVKMRMELKDKKGKVVASTIELQDPAKN